MNPGNSTGRQALPDVEIPHVISLQARNYQPSSVSAPFKLDEGYSDDTRSQPDNDSKETLDEVMTLPDWVMAHSEADRAELAYSLLRTLRSSTVAAVVERLIPMLHMDPVLKLPPEITSEIFSYLDSKSLLTASLASRTWRDRIYDSRLWRQLYINEGWRVDIDAIRKFEKEHSEFSATQARKSRTRYAESDASEPKLKKRVPPSWLDLRNAGQRGVFGRTQSLSKGSETNSLLVDEDGDGQMVDASNNAIDEPPSCVRDGRTVVGASRSSMQPPVTSQPPTKPSILLRLASGSVKVNWPYLFKQRRRLEENWAKGRYTTFRLPHPHHPVEAHTECVYAMHFSGRWLVSGSRDRTVRVWDLDTKRLWYPPLLGHTKSVLCLQFDPSPSEDVIISGSSDKNVIVWKFSTGEKIHEIMGAHDDSVLNIRFDKRFLVTCSKDKLIKVWNRRDLTATDPNYPKVHNGTGVTYPSYIVDTSDMSSSVLEAGISSGQIKNLAPYSLLMTLDGHGAAVNAIQMNEDEIVSASGDRLIKVWNIHNGACIKTIYAHDKGIACVQFDNGRIISGSNDNTVRIFDHASGAELARLHGHHNLVRTVQAGFGDPPGAEETMRLEALAIEHEYWDARRSGALEDIASHSRTSRIRNQDTTGSRNPKDIMALGASIPPGGGGSRWGRIVSGSYDETVIIWKKDREDKWVVSHRLRQADAARASAFAAERSAQGHGAQMSQLFPDRENPVPQQASQATSTPAPSAQLPPPNAPPEQPGPTSAAGTEPHGAVWTPGVAYPPPPASQAGTTVVALPQNPALVLASVGRQGPNRLTAFNQLYALHHHLARPLMNRPLNITTQQPTSRVFKLQFDARKIICASQDPIIVGWDFACDDDDIVEACQFFMGL